MSLRRCTRTACVGPAVATLTYVYADQTAVLGPLAVYAEPHSYDLCERHSEGLSAPRGWEVVRLAPDSDSLQPSHDDLMALADSVRDAARPDPPAAPSEPRLADTAGHEPHGIGRRGHLRVLPQPEQ